MRNRRANFYHVSIVVIYNSENEKVIENGGNQITQDRRFFFPKKKENRKERQYVLKRKGEILHIR